MKVTSGSKICSTLKREKERERDIIIYISSKISHSSLVLTSGSNKTNLFNPPCNNVRALYNFLLHTKITMLLKKSW